MVDVGGGPEPELRAVLPARVHHREVVLAVHQDAPLLVLKRKEEEFEHRSDCFFSVSKSL